MKRISIAIAALALMINVWACCCVVPPDIRVGRGPVLDVGPLQEKDETVALDGAESASVEILFGAGELDIVATDSDNLFVGNFVYNVEEWEPKVSYNDGKLRIEQGGDEDAWGWPYGSSSPRNEWRLEFSSQVPLDMDIKAGAGEGARGCHAGSDDGASEGGLQELAAAGWRAASSDALPEREREIGMGAGE